MTNSVVLTTSVPGVTFTKTGLTVPDEVDILNGRLNDLATAMGGAMSTSLTTPQGQIAMSDAAIIADKNDQLLAIVNQINPDYATGRFQDAIGRIYFLDRIPASGTTVTATCTGLVNTVIPIGSIAQDKKGYLYHSLTEVKIPGSGSVDVVFQNSTSGPLACQIDDLNTIYISVPGWSGISNASAGVPGIDEETRANFEYRRKQSVAKNATNSLHAIYAAVLEVNGVADAYVISNDTSVVKTVGVSKYRMVPNSIYSAVYGGKTEDVARVIWKKKPPGIPTNGNTTHTIVDDENYVQPYPEYEINYVIPAPIRVYVDVSLANSDYLPADIETQVKSAIAQAFNGEDGGTRARIASTLFAGRYYSGVYNIDTSSVDIYNITLSRDGITYSTSISFGIDEIPTLDVDNISVKLVGS
ncbi:MULTISPECIES: baseplate J/gp47 family protein [Photorhabdus]|uniref:Bacteriophage protein n=1 Tax=Photorhabdus thracensis TaxID=230089 RepID=A0A0F7LHX1_9GAMM|nr:baseplate J/gp47 family protein [Photorhabdus thracensis]AKH62275.1 bacteriophage protein [Photorhabdus thracensis]